MARPSLRRLGRVAIAIRCLSTSGIINHDESVFAQEYHEVTNYFNGPQGVPILSSGTSPSTTFGALRKKSNKRSLELYVGDPAEIERLRSLIFNKRVLVLSGESELGKTTTAIYLGSLLSAAGWLEKRK